MLGLLAYLMRTNAQLVEIDNSVGQWEVDHATHLSTQALQRVTDLAGTYVVVVVIIVVAIAEVVRIPNKWVPVFLVCVVVGEIVLVTTIKQALDRVRPSFNPAAATLGPSFPSGHSATAAALYAAVALVLARRRAPRTRALIAGGGGGGRGGSRVQPRDARSPLALGRHCGPRFRMGVVRDLRDCVRRPFPLLRRAVEDRNQHRRVRRENVWLVHGSPAVTTAAIPAQGGSLTACRAIGLAPRHTIIDDVRRCAGA